MYIGLAYLIGLALAIVIVAKGQGSTKSIVYETELEMVFGHSAVPVYAVIVTVNGESVRGPAAEISEENQAISLTMVPG